MENKYGYVATFKSSPVFGIIMENGFELLIYKHNGKFSIELHDEDNKEISNISAGCDKIINLIEFLISELEDLINVADKM